MVKKIVVAVITTLALTVSLGLSKTEACYGTYCSAGAGYGSHNGYGGYSNYGRYGYDNNGLNYDGYRNGNVAGAYDYYPDYDDHGNYSGGYNGYGNYGDRNSYGGYGNRMVNWILIRIYQIENLRLDILYGYLTSAWGGFGGFGGSGTGYSGYSGYY